MAEQESRLENKFNELNPPPRKPIIIRAFRAFKRQYHRYAAESEKRKSDHGENERTMVRWTRQVGIFTIVLSLIAALSASISYLQWREMQSQLQEIRASGEDTKRLIDAATKSAQAAEDTVALNRENAQRQLRAYVSIQDLGARVESNGITLAVEYRNSGQTPAYEVHPTVRLLATSNPSGTVIKLPTESVKSIAMIGSGMTLKQMGTVPLPEQFLNMIKDPKAQVFLYGQVTYRDVFDAIHTTKYRFKREKLSDSHWVFVIEPSGNETD